MEEQKRNERDNLLKEHHEKWRNINIRQEEICEKYIGHEFNPLPNNGWNRIRLDGTWPERCWICDKAR